MIAHRVPAAAPRLIVVLGLGLAISLLTSPGPLIQQTFLSVLDPDLTTIYGGLYGEEVFRFHGVSAWLTLAFQPIYLLIAVVSASVGLTARSIRSFLVAIWLSTASLLTVFDVIILLQAEQLTTAASLENILSNLVGSAALAFYLAIILAVVQTLLQPYKKRQWHAYALVSIGFSLSGLVGTLAVYLFLMTFLHLLPIHARTVATVPISGSIVNSESGAESNSEGRFALFPTNDDVEQLNLESGEATFEWRKTSDDATFDLKLYSTAECIAPPNDDQISQVQPAWQADDISALSLSLRGLTSLLRIVGTHSNFSVVGGPAYAFRVVSEDSSRALTVSKFLPGDAAATANTAGDVGLLVTVPVLETSDARTPPVGTTLTVLVGDRELRMALNPAAARLPKSRLLDCEISPYPVNASSSDILSDRPVAPGAYLQLRRSNGPGRYFTLTDSELNIEQADGWIEIPRLQPSAFRRSAGGKIGELELEGSIAELQVNGVPREVSRTQRFHGVGELHASYLADASLLVTGEYHAAWLDGRRLNPTRWETFDAWWKTTLGTLVTAIGFGFVGLASRQWVLGDRNVPVFWHNPQRSNRP